MPYTNTETKIHYETAGQGEPIVFHHGNGNCVNDWFTLGYVERLQDEFQLIMIDSRGYGKSDKPHNPAQYSLQNRADDTIAVLDALDIKQCHCLGASVGASMCMILARFYPKRFKSYIFATPYFTLFDETMKQALLNGPELYVEWLEKKYGEFDNKKVRESFLANDCEALWAANSSEWFDYHDYIQYIKVPSLIIAGEQEISVEELKALSKKLPNNEFKIIPNIGHKEAYWRSDLTAPIIQEFIRKRNAND